MTTTQTLRMTMRGIQQSWKRSSALCIVVFYCAPIYSQALQLATLHSSISRMDEDGKTANTITSVLIWEVHGLLQALPCHDDQAAKTHGDQFPRPTSQFTRRSS